MPVYSVSAFEKSDTPRIKADVKQQQTKKIKGTVVDNMGVPIIGANVMIKGTTNGTITDMDGQFSLDASDNDVLQISYIGYNTQTIVIGDKDVL